MICAVCATRRGVEEFNERVNNRSKALLAGATAQHVLSPISPYCPLTPARPTSHLTPTPTPALRTASITTKSSILLCSSISPLNGNNRVSAGGSLTRKSSRKKRLHSGKGEAVSRDEEGGRGEPQSGAQEPKGGDMVAVRCEIGRSVASKPERFGRRSQRRLLHASRCGQ